MKRRVTPTSQRRSQVADPSDVTSPIKPEPNDKAAAATPLLTSRRGRPTKFGRPARAVTLTLPEDVIAALGQLDEDLGRAVVRVSQPFVAKGVDFRPAELAQHGRTAVIVVRPTAALNRIAGVLVVPLPDGRGLISLAETLSVHQFELELRDALAEDSQLSGDERATLTAIGDILKTARQTRGVNVHRRGIVVLQFERHRNFAE